MIKSKKFVIQKYIEKPLLFENKKFDIRLYIMVTPGSKVYRYQEMYIRVSAYDFDLDNMQKFGHLNNIALQKYSENYDGEKAVITTQMLEDHVKEKINPDFDFEKDIRPKLNHIIAIMSTFISEKLTLFHATKKYFEIFGLDFMIDQKNGVWLIEANTNPALSTGNSFLDQLIPRMLDDAWKITLDRQFPLPTQSSGLSRDLGQEWLADVVGKYKDSVFSLLDYDDDLNLWDLISKEEVAEALKTNPN
jgi:hypothetical protein